VPAPAQTQDLRNADQRVPAPAQTQDLRNADRRAPEPVSSGPAPEVTTFEVAGDGFDWGDAGIGAAGGIAALVLAGGLATVATHRRRGTRIPA
jgi:hypothetical protein